MPAAYVRLEALPLTPNGKLDRKALPAPEGDAYASREYEAPVGKIEVALAEIWAELLRVERVGRRDNFFELGGHSLLALQVVSRVRQELGVELALAAVFEKPVLAALAERILELRLAVDPKPSHGSRSSFEPAARRSRAATVCLARPGSLFWIQRTRRLRDEYARQGAFRGSCGGRAAFGQAVFPGQRCGEIVRRHEALRTVVPQSSATVQAVAQRIAARRADRTCPPARSVKASRRDDPRPTLPPAARRGGPSARSTSPERAPLGAAAGPDPR